MAIIDEKVLWASADKLRGSIGASDYMHIVLGLIFLKYISDRFEEKYENLLLKVKALKMIRMNTHLNIFSGFLKKQDGIMFQLFLNKKKLDKN